MYLGIAAILLPRTLVAIGTKRHFAALQQTVAFGGKADIAPEIAQAPPPGRYARALPIRRVVSRSSERSRPLGGAVVFARLNSVGGFGGGSALAIELADALEEITPNGGNCIRRISWHHDQSAPRRGNYMKSTNAFFLRSIVASLLGSKGRHLRLVLAISLRAHRRYSHTVDNLSITKLLRLSMTRVKVA